MDIQKISKLDFTKVCRTCLQVKKNVSSDRNAELFNKLHFSIGLKLEQDDNLPNLFCKNCIEHINTMYDFKKLCLCSQQILSDVLKNVSVNNTKISVKDEQINNFDNEFLREDINQSVINCGNIKTDTVRDEDVNNIFINELSADDDDDDDDPQKDDEAGTEVNKSISLMLTNLIKRNVEKLEGTDRYRCTLCGKECKLRYYLRKHMLLHIPRERRLKYCTICGKAYTRKDTYAKHLRDHENRRKGDELEDVKIYKCSECQRLFDNQDDLDKHKIAHIPKKNRIYKCLDCHRFFNRQDHLDKHKLVHIPKENRTRHCLHCDKYYLREDTYQRHIKIHQNGSGKQLCKICGKTYLQLSYHIVRVHGEKSYNCLQCDSKFSRQYYLDKHVKDVHQDIKNKKNYLHLCPHCGKRFEGLGIFKSHIALHEGKKLFKCKICNREFTFKTNLRNHMRHHQSNTVKNYKCIFCDKRFSISATLKSHIRTHTGERPYSCKICQRAFAQRSALRTHMKIHNLEDVKI